MKKSYLWIVAIVWVFCILAIVILDTVLIKVVLVSGILAAAFFAIYHWLVRPAAYWKKEAEQAQEKKEELSEMRTDFVANVTHELKTPLTSISGFIETLQSGAAEDPEIRNRFLDIMAIETSRLKRLINDILVLSEIENREVIKEEKIQVTEVLEEVVQLVEPVADEKHISLVTDFGNGLVLRGSRDRLIQMVVNIVENAIKYSDEEPTVEMSSFLSDGHVVIAVKDQGIGIAQEDIPRLFERFYRVDKSRSSKGGGTGLGLSIVKHISALFGATIEVDSEVGKGSTFRIRF